MTYGPIDFLALEFQNERLKGEILTGAPRPGRQEDHPGG